MSGNNSGFKPGLSDHYLGSLYALISATGFGVLPIFALYAYQGGINVHTLIFVRFSLTAVIMFAYLAVSGRAVVKPRQLKYLFLMGGCFYAAQNLCYFSALKYIPASQLVLIFYTYPIVLALISRFTGQRVGLDIVFSIIMSFSGLILILGRSAAGVNYQGVLLAAGAAFFYALYAFVGDYLLKDLDLVVLLAYVSLSAALVFFILGSAAGTLNFNLPAASWLPVLLIILLSITGFLTFFQGIKLTTPVTVGVLGMSEPLATIFLSILLLAEKMSPIQAAGAVLVLLGSLLVIFRNHQGKDEMIKGR